MPANRFVGKVRTAVLYSCTALLKFPRSTEIRFFKIGRALHGVDQVRDQVRAPLIYILHLRPALIDFLLQTNQSIIAAGDSAPADQNNEKNDGTNAETTDKTFIHRK